MGAWGYGFFENDGDLDAIGDLAYECGLDTLEEEAQSKARAEHAKAASDTAKQESDGDGRLKEEAQSKKQTEHASTSTGEAKEENGGHGHLEEAAQNKTQTEHASATIDAIKSETDDNAADDSYNCYGIMYSLYAGYCSDTKLVREYLESSGALKDLIENNKGYTLVLVGVCAMSLGCTLSEDFLTALRKLIPRIDLRAKKLRQVDKALNGPDGFESGKEYDFQSKGLLEMANNPDEEEEEEMW